MHMNHGDIGLFERAPILDVNQYVTEARRKNRFQRVTVLCLWLEKISDCSM
jgi:hypothetical protein